MWNDNMHIGRSFSGTRLEDACPCEKQLCGLVKISDISKDCTEHNLLAGKTIRQMHSDEECPEHN